MSSTFPGAQTVDERVAALSIEQQIGLLYQPMILVGDGFDLDTRPPWGGPSARELIGESGIRFFCIGGPATPRHIREATTMMQEYAISVGSRLPAVFSSDPRHGFVQNDAATHSAQGLSQWPEPIGFGALRDAAAVREFADIVRTDYLAMGLRLALHPQVDLPTEPRWARQAQSFAVDHTLSSELAAAYIEGLQGTRLGARAVAATTKHFPGGGPQLDGEDPHFPYGREQIYPGGRFADHLAPFRSAIDAGSAVIMPYYGMPVGLELDGRPVEEVGFAFNRRIITELLREELGFEGVVLSDFGLISDQQVFGKPFPARAWGVEHLEEDRRLERLLHAGIDQLGGESDTARLYRLVDSGRVDAARIAVSARRLVALQRDLGLLDAPGAEPLDGPIATREQIDLGRRTQSRAMTVLIVGDVDGVPILPLPSAARAHLVGFGDAARLHSVAEVDADVAVMRIASPFDPRDHYFLENGMQQGSLDLPDSLIESIVDLCARLPVVLVVHLARPAVLTPVADVVTALVVDYGASDESVLAALRGVEIPRGVLPFDLPRTMQAVIDSRPDVASDSLHPLFTAGSGIRLTTTPFTSRADLEIP
ncbi:glycoside hydrolase family 3 protein [Subtercola frigoramans]|uniref:beta-glucosidase n=1 Tax=Subtercola frigoramans TaxID=120298 RepID=A0ABS2L295_9MICO|nr:glycoside hydrolase family 3 N-terminal domain-containing protein [Subtercola frigoramans]MBM7471207.1 beta-glucosidase [Subtercola frigoramans]